MVQARRRAMNPVVTSGDTAWTVGGFLGRVSGAAISVALPERLDSSGEVSSERWRTFDRWA